VGFPALDQKRRLELFRGCVIFSLSPGERARVRGKRS